MLARDIAARAQPCDRRLEVAASRESDEADGVSSFLIDVRIPMIFYYVDEQSAVIWEVLLCTRRTFTSFGPEQFARNVDDEY